MSMRHTQEDKPCFLCQSVTRQNTFLLCYLDYGLNKGCSVQNLTNFILLFIMYYT